MISEMRTKKYMNKNKIQQHVDPTLAAKTLTTCFLCALVSHKNNSGPFFFHYFV